MTAAPTPALQKKSRSLWRDAWRRLLRNKAAMAGAVVIVAMSLGCLAGPFLMERAYGYTFESQDLENQYAPPSAKHWFGTDAKGRDLFVRCLIGGRVSLSVGLAATLVSMVIGVAYGVVAGYAGGKVDEFMMRAVDTLNAIPYIVMVSVLILLVDHPNVTGFLMKLGFKESLGHLRLVLLFVALGLILWTTLARITRGQVLTVKNQEFVEAARAAGARTPRIMAAHIVPNILGPIIVYTTLTVPGVMLNEAFLSFLGLGVQAPMASWGSLASEGGAFINPLRVYWWLIFFPGMLLAATLFALNFFGDGLRDALDPRSKEKVF